VHPDPNGDDEMLLWCAHAGEKWLDRRVCSAPCDAMHMRCSRCGAAVGGCPFEQAGQHDRLVRLVRAARHCDELTAAGIVGEIETAGRLGLPMSFNSAELAMVLEAVPELAPSAAPVIDPVPPPLTASG
jgi:hypothetical protein